MAITVTAQPGNVPPRVEISVTGLTDATTNVTRLDPDGRTRAVRSAEPAAVTAGSWLGYDYEMPLGQPVTYTSTPPINAAATSSPVTVTTADGWLVNPGVPDLSMRLSRLNVARLEDRVRAARAAVLQPLGRNTPVVVSETRSSVQAGISVLTESLAERDTFLTVLDTGAPLLLNIPPAWAWGVTWEYVSVGDVAESFVGVGTNVDRLFTLPYVVVDRPVGALQAQWTYTGVLTQYATYNDVLAAYGTYNDLLANSPS